MYCTRTRALVLVIALALFAGFAPPSHADDPVVIDADVIIQACWDAPKEARGGDRSTADMRKDTLDTIDCLEDAIYDQIEPLFPDGRFMPRVCVEDTLEMLRLVIHRFYWTLYNENEKCNPSCGTMWHPMHLAAHADILEEILQDIVALR